MATPLYTVATPWVWYGGELNRDVASEYQKIRKHFNVIKNYPPTHHREVRKKAVEFFKAKFGIKDLEGLVGNITFFEHLALLSRNVSGSSSDVLDPLRGSRGKELVMVLVGAMRGVTHRRGDKWLSAVKDLVCVVQKITSTLALEESSSVIIIRS
ncbi:hypothetical protein EDC04DRAFT_724062 [Pisolithus marmoratus]|nr:hypothetical protein EDC04DRAFT_724062 [Pisolithus marmoratus]